MATINYVAAMTPLEAAIKEWHAYHERQVDGLKAKILSLEAQLQEQGGVGGQNDSMEGPSLKQLKQSFLEGVQNGDGGAQAMEQRLRDKDREIAAVREEARMHLQEKQVRPP